LPQSPTKQARDFSPLLRQFSVQTFNLSSSVIAPFPNNHKYSTIQVSQLVASVSDGCSALRVGDVVIEKVTSDEADNAPGNSDGSTTNDFVIAAGCRSVQLRAERDDSRNGRVYTITLLLREAADWRQHDAPRLNIHLTVTVRVGHGLRS